MMIGYRQRVRVARARAHALDMLASGVTMTGTVARRNAAALRECLPSRVVVDDSPGVIVTECGFVTMAVLCRHARRFERALTVPGVDDRGERGFLVLRAGHPPFHSLAAEADAAVNEAIVAQTRATALVAGFGGRERMRAAVRAAPWHLRTTLADTERAGLCRWGSESFLRRLALHTIATRLGLPRALLRLAGGYGERATAATLLRHATDVGARASAPARAFGPAATTPSGRRVTGAMAAGTRARRDGARARRPSDASLTSGMGRRGATA